MNGELTKSCTRRHLLLTGPLYSRHLLRLWLRDPEYAWETPGPLTERWGGLYDGVTPEKEVFPLDPVVRSASNSTDQQERKA